MIDIIDYGSGNMGSLSLCLERLRIPYRRVTRKDELIDSVHPMILPGVGAFSDVINRIEAQGFDEAIRIALVRGRALLGICIGMQVFFESSEEAPGVSGLGLIRGSVIRFKEGKVPHVGWNWIEPSNGSQWPAGYAYFVNSYVAQPKDAGTRLYTSDYHGPFCAAVRAGSITGFQFHPEKSGTFGQSLVRRWFDAL